jgi:DNA mismatch repair ATPase MutS
VPNEVFEKNKQPKEFELTFQSKTVKRFVTWEIRRKMEELDTAEIRMRASIMPFICSLFAYFHSKKQVWAQVVSCLSEIDALCALATVSAKNNG